MNDLQISAVDRRAISPSVSSTSASKSAFHLVTAIPLKPAERLRIRTSTGESNPAVRRCTVRPGKREGRQESIPARPAARRAAGAAATPLFCSAPPFASYPSLLPNLPACLLACAPAIRLSRVLLPEPYGPILPSNVTCWTSKLTF